MNLILGAGLSGLICGALNANARIFERNPSSFVEHRAVLRFRDDKIARATGVTFRRVTVRKAIWTDDREEPPSPRLANRYNRKVRGVISDASIWNTAPSERFIAPDDLHAILADICGRRVRWDHEVTAEQLADYRKHSLPVISTLPLPILLPLLSASAPFQFTYSPITVSRFTVPDCDVYQTIYFPNPGTAVYRATLTGSLLTVESAGLPGETGALTDHELEDVKTAFGLTGLKLEPREQAHRQSFGKIAPVPDAPRKALLHRLTVGFGIYSLGRFATWRNILLDDVYEDIAVIRRMMSQALYDVTLERTKAQ